MHPRHFQSPSINKSFNSLIFKPDHVYFTQHCLNSYRSVSPPPPQSHISSVRGPWQKSSQKPSKFVCFFGFSDVSGSLRGTKVDPCQTTLFVLFISSPGKCSICTGSQATVPTHLRLVWERCSCDLRFDLQKGEHLMWHSPSADEQGRRGETVREGGRAEDKGGGKHLEIPAISSLCHELEWEGKHYLFLHSCIARLHFLISGMQP